MRNQCVECEEIEPTLSCVQCEEDFCDECFKLLHRKGKRATHTTTLIEIKITNESLTQEKEKRASINTTTSVKKVSKKEIKTERDRGVDAFDDFFDDFFTTSEKEKKAKQQDDKKQVANCASKSKKSSVKGTVPGTGTNKTTKKIVKHSQAKGRSQVAEASQGGSAVQTVGGEGGGYFGSFFGGIGNLVGNAVEALDFAIDEAASAIDGIVEEVAGAEVELGEGDSDSNEEITDDEESEIGARYKFSPLSNMDAKLARPTKSLKKSSKSSGVRSVKSSIAAKPIAKRTAKKTIKIVAQGEESALDNDDDGGGGEAFMEKKTDVYSLYTESEKKEIIQRKVLRTFPPALHPLILVIGETVCKERRNKQEQKSKNDEKDDSNKDFADDNAAIIVHKLLDSQDPKHRKCVKLVSPKSLQSIVTIVQASLEYHLASAISQKISSRHTSTSYPRIKIEKGPSEEEKTPEVEARKKPKSVIKPTKKAVALGQSHPNTHQNRKAFSQSAHEKLKTKQITKNYVTETETKENLDLFAILG